jgi:hypothetical protein
MNRVESGSLNVVRIGNSYLLFVILGVCIVAYINGVFGGFILDDYHNIVNNALLQAVDGSMYHWLLSALSSDQDH